MPADETKLSAASAFDSVKNYDNPTEQSVTFSGSLASGATMTRTITFSITRSEGAIGDFLINYSGSPNTAANWLFGPGPLRWGLATLSGFGNQPIKVFESTSATQVQFTLTLFNGDAVTRSIATAVTVTIRPALFVAPF